MKICNSFILHFAYLLALANKRLWLLFDIQRVDFGCRAIFWLKELIRDNIFVNWGQLLDG